MTSKTWYSIRPDHVRQEIGALENDSQNSETLLRSMQLLDHDLPRWLVLRPGVGTCSNASGSITNLLSALGHESLLYF